MTLEQLRIFIAVAERQHLTQAAGALALTPAAVSASIKGLEERYGVALFDRVGRRIELSAAGRAFLAEAKAALAMARNAERTLAELSGLQRGTLDIHASQTIASYWLPPLLVRFRQRYPNIQLILTAGNTRSVAQAVLEGAADIGFIEGGIDEAELQVQTVGDDRMVVVVAPGHPWAGRRQPALADLVEGEWIMREQGSGTRSAFENAMEAAGVAAAQLKVVLELPSNEAVRAAVASGPYAAVMSALVVAEQLASGALREVKFAMPPRGFFLLRHRSRSQSAAAMALQQMIAGAPAAETLK